MDQKTVTTPIILGIVFLVDKSQDCVLLKHVNGKFRTFQINLSDSIDMRQRIVDELREKRIDIKKDDLVLKKITDHTKVTLYVYTLNENVIDIAHLVLYKGWVNFPKNKTPLNKLDKNEAVSLPLIQ